ncbi:hypothetical protein SAMIE_1016770 [Sphingobium amiense]|uniref:Uncharacterized protein n=1 Tax=Sphingobium amiense TaxID=135719 RepID=A0A494W4A4_9SPHN|nr:hypothetical protein [Sphingobium amiense]BBD98176.1 hypothetical protein SAMIE_1016770 [Sphingobium amiense]
MSKVIHVVSLIMLAASFLSGPYSIYLAALRRYRSSLGILILGIILGFGGLIGSFIAANIYYGELEARGNKVMDDMQGYGQAVVAGLGLIYFSAVFAIIVMIAAVRGVYSWHLSRKNGHD